MIFNNLPWVTALGGHRVVPFTYSKRNDLDARASVMEGCETIHYWAADPDITKAVTPEKLNVE
jgi:hypothetical protein